MHLGLAGQISAFLGLVLVFVLTAGFGVSDKQLTEYGRKAAPLAVFLFLGAILFLIVELAF